MNFLEHQKEFKDGGPGKESHRPPPPLRVLQKTGSVDESRIYRKHGAPSGNGSVGGLGRKIQRQNSINLPLSGPSSASGGPRQMSGVIATVVDTDKLLAAKKRRQESLLPSANRRPLRTWSEKCKIFATICVSTLLILTAASFLFISLLIVDPVLVGLRAHFRTQPGICRTSEYRNLTGPIHCVMPSCREGCTADLYTCIFVYVNYFEVSGLNFSFVQSYYNEEIEDWDSEDRFSFSEFHPMKNNNSKEHYNKSHSVAATLMINPNGCGYPPEVNCSNFYYRFQSVGTLFPCFYSDSFFNEGMAVAVPFYDRNEEITTFGLYFGIPLGTLIVLCLLLLLLSRLQRPERTLPPLFPNYENPPAIRTPFSRKKVTNSSRLKNGKPSFSTSEDSEDAFRLEEISERVNGHGPKKKTTPFVETETWNEGHSFPDKTENVMPRVISEQVQRPSTSGNLP